MLKKNFQIMCYTKNITIEHANLATHIEEGVRHMNKVSDTKTNKTVPLYILEMKEIVAKENIYPLKDLFNQLRKKYPEVISMRMLKSEIEEYSADYRVNKNNQIVSKNSIMSDILSIIS